MGREDKYIDGDGEGGIQRLVWRQPVLKSKLSNDVQKSDTCIKKSGSFVVTNPVTYSSE